MKSGVLFSGYYGLGNAGDEAVLAASVGMLRERQPQLPIGVLSADPEGTRRALSVEAWPRMRPAAVGAIRRCRLFLSGGGSLLQDRTSLKSLLYYLFLLDLARWSGARTMVFAQGIGPLDRPSARRHTARVLSRVDAITVRDADSADLLREIGVRGPVLDRIEVTADPVFALAPQETSRVSALFAAPPVVGVSLRPWPGAEAILEPLARALRELPPGTRVQGWPLFPEEDTAPCEALARRVPGMTVVREELTPAEWMALAGRAQAVVGMRLHSLIFAAARATPVVGISYDPKVDALLARLHSQPSATSTSLDPAKVRDAVLAALRENPERLRDRQARAAHLRDAAFRSADCALELLK